MRQGDEFFAGGIETCFDGAAVPAIGAVSDNFENGDFVEERFGNGAGPICRSIVD